MGTTYRANLLTGAGGVERLEVRDLPLPEPGPGEVRVRVRACGVGSTEVGMMRRGSYPFAPKVPFTPGYDVVGDVEAVGDGVRSPTVGQRVAALTVHGGFVEVVVRPVGEFVPVPSELDDAEAAASAEKRALVKSLGADFVASRNGSADVSVRRLVSEGVDFAFDAIGGPCTVQCLRAARRGGMVVGYGWMGTSRDGKQSTALVLRTIATLLVGSTLAGRQGALYEITGAYRADPRPFREDLSTLFETLRREEIRPLIAARMPLLEARKAVAMLEAGGARERSSCWQGDWAACQDDCRRCFSNSTFPRGPTRDAGQQEAHSDNVHRHQGLLAPDAFRREVRDAPPGKA